MSNSKWWFLLVCFIPAITFASEGGEHSDPVTSVLLGVTTILFLAIIGRYLARLLNQPGVLGELLIGMIVGNLSYFFGSELVVILREGSAIYDVVKEMLAGISLNQAVTHVIHNSYYANQVIHALSGAEGTEYLKIAYVVDIFSRYGVIFLLFMVGLETSLSDLKKLAKNPFLLL